VPAKARQLNYFIFVSLNSLLFNQFFKTMRRNIFTVLALLLLMVMVAPRVQACTSVLVSRGASADGSVMTSYLYDVAGFVQPLHFYPGGTYEPGDSLDVFGFRDGEFLGRIAQVPQTYRVIGNMNEHQVAMGETTFTGRSELHGQEGVLDYGNLIWITLQRARTAREAIHILDDLARTYGYIDTGETFFFADKDEVWIMDFIGKGKHGRGGVWVAARVPEGYIAAHANQSRIRYVDWNDTENWMWSEDVVDFAREMGFFTGRRNRNFSFREAYDPVTPRSLLMCESRVWSVYNRAAPSANYSADYWRCVEGAEPYPLFIKPDEKLSIEDMIALVRDHFHDTPYYTREGLAAGPFGSPYRWRPVTFQIEGDDAQYAYERSISQPQTAFSFVTQSRNWLPNDIGGICWYSVDDTYSTVFMPLYMGMKKAPPSLLIGSSIEFDWNSAFWVFNKVANHAYPLYSLIIPDIQKVQRELETRAHTLSRAVDRAAMAMAETDPDFVREYVTDFSVNTAEGIVERWRELGFYLFVKYNDGYIRGTESIHQWPQGVGYPDEFNRRAVEDRPAITTCAGASQVNPSNSRTLSRIKTAKAFHLCGFFWRI
jgi:dipeptidase